MERARGRRRLLRGRITYANVTATLALVLAMSGGALAARHYLINSTTQIKPSVLKKLHGARGGRGPTGFIGPIGPQGPTGPVGPKGSRGPTGGDGFSALSNLPGGETESGDFAISLLATAPGQTLVGAASFPIALAAPLAVKNVIVTSSSVPVEKCAGPGQASRGYLCIYTTSLVNAEPPAGSSPVSNPEAAPLVEGSGRHGFRLMWLVKEAGAAEAAGTWSATG